MKTYYLAFGAGDPRTFTGLSATFLIFVDSTGATISPPSITEALTGSGLYKFSWGTTNPISFLADAATTSPGPQGRYVAGSLDPADRIDEYGNTLTALSTTLQAGLTGSIAGIGSTSSSFGTVSADPTTLFGYMKRILEDLEGNQSFLKATGVLTSFDRTGGTTIGVKTVTNSNTLVIKV